MLTNVTSCTTSLEKPGPQPFLGAIVESPTRIIRIGGSGGRGGNCAMTKVAANSANAEKRICFRMVIGPKRICIRLRNDVKCSSHALTCLRRSSINVGMEHLWAPWRIRYILGEKESGCFFCNDSQSSDDAKSHIIVRERNCFAILNRFPYNPGHLMVAPYKHTGEIDDLSEQELSELMALTRRCKQL